MQQYMPQISCIVAFVLIHVVFERGMALFIMPISPRDLAQHVCLVTLQQKPCCSHNKNQQHPDLYCCLIAYHAILLLLSVAPELCLTVFHLADSSATGEGAGCWGLAALPIPQRGVESSCTEEASRTPRAPQGFTTRTPRHVIIRWELAILPSHSTLTQQWSLTIHAVAIGRHI